MSTTVEQVEMAVDTAIDNSVDTAVDTTREAIPSGRFTPRNVSAELGLLADLAGTWEGFGFNLIARPAFHFGTDLYLQLNNTRETLKFDPIGSVIPNRGFGQHDIGLHGLTYLQKISDAGKGRSPAYRAGHLDPAAQHKISSGEGRARRTRTGGPHGLHSAWQRDVGGRNCQSLFGTAGSAVGDRELQRLGFSVVQQHAVRSAADRARHQHQRCNLVGGTDRSRLGAARGAFS